MLANTIVKHNYYFMHIYQMALLIKNKYKYYHYLQIQLLIIIFIYGVNSYGYSYVEFSMQIERHHLKGSFRSYQINFLSPYYVCNSCDHFKIMRYNIYKYIIPDILNFIIFIT